MTRRILVVGLGRFGSALAESLTHAGCEVVAIDNDMTHIEEIKNKVAYALELDATDPVALRSIDAHTCQAAVVAIGENFEGAVLAVAALRELGVQHIIARAISHRHGRILTAAGANRVVEIEWEMGRALGRELSGGADLAAQATAAALATSSPGGLPPPGSGGTPPGYGR
jgi:trk system potassium uptake protein TrkA